MNCPPGNWMERICALEEMWGQISTSLGHPPLAASEGPAFAFNPDTQVLVVPEPVAQLPADTVRVADDAARAAATPTHMGQILIQTTDATNGANSLWVPTSLATGAWTLKVGSLGTQNAGAVAITGGSISGISPPLPIGSGGTAAASAAGARVNLALPTAFPAAGVIDWTLSDNYAQVISANTVWTFANVNNGLRLAFVVVDTGIHTHTFPPEVVWPSNIQPVATVGGEHLYLFDAIGGYIFGRAYVDYPVPPP